MKRLKRMRKINHALSKRLQMKARQKFKLILQTDKWLWLARKQVKMQKKMLQMLSRRN